MTSEKVCEILGAVNLKELKTLPNIVFESVSSGETTGSEMLENGLLAGMAIVGDKFKAEKIFLPQVMLAAKTMKECIEKIKVYIASDDVCDKGRVCIGTVLGDHHDIGKNIVKIMMEGKGIKVFDLGIDVSPEQFLSFAVENNCDIICLSALLTYTMPVMSDTVKLVRESGRNIKVMIGGAPVTQEYADEIGADGYTKDAATAAEKAMELIKSKI